MKQKLVKDYMTIQSHLVSFQPDTDIHFVVKTLIRKSISGAPVVDSQGDLVGVISEKDCLRVLMEMAMHEMPGGTVDKYMSSEVTTIGPENTIIEAVGRFQKSYFRRFPVVENGKLVGILSRRDVLRAVEEIGRG